MIKRSAIFVVLLAAGLGLGWAAFQAATPSAQPLSHYVPSGALLYLEAKDFSSLLSDWNSSSQKKDWATSSNYEVFSRSRLFLRLQGASDQFAAAAGLPPNMNFLTQVAGKQSALAVYDIGKLQFLYITRLSSASSMRSELWQSHAKFETRSADGTTFYLRRDPESEREVEFAIAGDYLLLATREDLMAGALQLMAGGQDSTSQARTVESEPWWSQSVAATGPAGDLRMVLNLEKIVPSPYFRSYWVQQNITGMKQYSTAISDLFRSGKEYREERVLLRKTASTESSPEGPQAVADLVRLVPEGAGVYAAKASPSTDSCFDLLETKLLAPHFGAAPPQPMAPAAPIAGEDTGTASDLESRIDETSARHPTFTAGSSLKELLQQNPAHAMLQVQSTERDKNGVFVRMRSTFVLAASSDWNDAAVRSALADFVRPALTASEMGVGWQQQNGYQQLDGLYPLLVAVRGKYLVVSDDSATMTAVLSNMKRKADTKPAVFVAGFDHQHERENFTRLASLVDRPNLTENSDTPQFFSGNIASLSSALSGVSSENIVVRDAGDKVLQTVVYAWAQ